MRINPFLVFLSLGIKTVISSINPSCEEEFKVYEMIHDFSKKISMAENFHEGSTQFNDLENCMLQSLYDHDEHRFYQSLKILVNVTTERKFKLNLARIINIALNQDIPNEYIINLLSSFGNEYFGLKVNTSDYFGVEKTEDIRRETAPINSSWENVYGYGL